MAAAVHQDIRQGSLTDFGLTPAWLFDRWPLRVVSAHSPALRQNGRLGALASAFLQPAATGT